MTLSRDDRKNIGRDIKTIQFGWPLGMPLVRKLDRELWEVRSHLDKRIARIVFTVLQDVVVLLHGFVKKSQKIPTTDLEVARKRLVSLKEQSL